MTNTEHRTGIQFYTRKRLRAIESTKELLDIYGDSIPSYCTVAKWIAEFNDPIRALEDAPRSGRPMKVFELFTRDRDA